MKRIAILGSGGQAREVAWLIRDINRQRQSYEFMGFVVDVLDRSAGNKISEYVLGDENWLEANLQRVDCLAIGIGSPAVRLKVADKMTKTFPDLEWPTLIHPTAIYDQESCDIQHGTLVCAGTTCTININIGSFSLLNFGCTIGHDVRIGCGCVVNPGANISGGVILGDGVLVGTGAQVLQYLRIGTAATVGAGAVVVRNVEPGLTVVGIPAKSMLEND